MITGFEGGELNTRRRLVIALGACALASPVSSLAQQQTKVWRVGFLALPDRATALDPLFSGAFLSGMRDLGYVEGKNLVIEWQMT
jgi:putative tryptophan/tyrosine transport system substrate-binding protein